MDSKTNIPSFTVSLRGYDRVEVDEYLDSLAEALGHVDDAQEQIRRLQAHIGRLNSRIKDLEDRIGADTPRTGAILGERIGILLRSAEETATDTVERAEARAAQVVAEAELRLAEAEESARVTIAGGQEQARRIEAAARAEAAEIISEAEARAGARTRQIEQWAEQVVSHTRAEEARMLREQQEKRQAALADLRSIGEQRDSVAATLAELRETLGQALGLVVPAAPGADRVLDGRSAEEDADPAGGVEGTEALDTAGGGEISEAAAGPEHDVYGAVAAEPEADNGTAPAVEAEGGRTEAAEGAGSIPADPADSAADQLSEAEPIDEPQRVGAEAAAAGDPVTDWVPFAEEPQDWQPAPAGGRPPFDGEAEDEPVTAQIEAVHPVGDAEATDGDDPGADHNGMAASASDDPEFEAKLEAWVSEGARHFKRG